MSNERSDQIRQIMDVEQGSETQPLQIVLGFDELAVDAPFGMSLDCVSGLSRPAGAKVVPVW